MWQRCEGCEKCERIGCFTVSRVALTAVLLSALVCVAMCVLARAHARARVMLWL